ncbi:MAG: hypothetical protein ACP5DC_08990 [Halothiobacillaceae bacterium]
MKQFEFYASDDATRQLMILDDDGGESLLTWTEAYGTDAAADLFKQWLEQAVADYRLRMHRDCEAHHRRRGFEVISGLPAGAKSRGAP